MYIRIHIYIYHIKTTDINHQFSTGPLFNHYIHYITPYDCQLWPSNRCYNSWSNVNHPNDICPIAHLYISLSAHLSVCPLTRLSVHLQVCMSMDYFACPSKSLSVHLQVCLFIYKSVCPSRCLSVHL
jgi:hypothetical protein